MWMTAGPGGAAAGAGFDDGADRLDTLDVSGHARQEAFGRPAAIAVHDDGNVARHLGGIRDRSGRTRIFHENFSAKG